MLYPDSLKTREKLSAFCGLADSDAGFPARKVPQNWAELLRISHRQFRIISSKDFRVMRRTEYTVLRLFPALLAHEVLNPVWAVAARFGVGAAVRPPGYPSWSRRRNTRGPRFRNAARLVASGT